MRSQTIDSNDEKNNRLHEKSLAPCSVYFNVELGGVYFNVGLGGVYLTSRVEVSILTSNLEVFILTSRVEVSILTPHLEESRHLKEGRRLHESDFTLSKMKRVHHKDGWWSRAWLCACPPRDFP